MMNDLSQFDVLLTFSTTRGRQGEKDGNCVPPRYTTARNLHLRLLQGRLQFHYLGLLDHQSLLQRLSDRVCTGVAWCADAAGRRRNRSRRGDWGTGYRNDKELTTQIIRCRQGKERSKDMGGKDMWGGMNRGGGMSRGGGKNIGGGKDIRGGKRKNYYIGRKEKDSWGKSAQEVLDIVVNTDKHYRQA
tara:strand:- start:358 stop:921 length:564 start_codon:yes stop_codon:yes gene_type:complete